MKFLYNLQCLCSNVHNYEYLTIEKLYSCTRGVRNLIKVFHFKLILI